MTPPEKKPYYAMTSLVKAFNIMELLANKGPMSVSQVAQVMGIPRSGSHRFLANLRALGYVVQNADSKYQLSFKLFQMGMNVVSGLEIRQVARPFMEELADHFSETVILGYLDGDEVIYVDKIQSTHTLRADLALGNRVPVYCTSMGKAIVSVMPERQQKALLDAIDFKVYTPFTITDRLQLQKDLDQARQNGFATCNQEFHMGITAIAAPVFNYDNNATYALSVSGPTFRMSEERIVEIQKTVKEATSRLSDRMGHLKSSN